MMTGKLAVYTPVIGSLSETFIRRHAQDLLPGNTVVITDAVEEPKKLAWYPDSPLLVLNNPSNFGLKERLLRVTDPLHWQPISIRSAVVKKFLQKLGVTVLLSEFLPHSLEWIEICEELRIKIFAHAHGYDVSAGYLNNPEWRLRYKTLSKADGIITINQISKQKLIALGLNPNRIFVVPCGVDVQERPYQHPDRDVVHCLAVGRMVGKKAPVLLLDAFRRAVDVNPNLHLDYLGGGELLPSAYQYVQAFNLYDKVTLHGSQPNAVVQQQMRNADIFLQHSITDPVSGDQEGLPVAILEAMANSLPVVSTYHAGIPEAVQHQRTGFLVDEGNTCLMAGYILDLSKDHELRIKMGINGWEQARQNFSWKLERSRLLDILELR